MIPYSQFAFEYPPLALINIYLPQLLQVKNHFTEYYLIFALIMFFIDYCCLKTCQIYCSKRLLMNEEEVSYMTLLYTLFGLLMFRILYHRLDLVIALFFAISLLTFKAHDSKLRPYFFINGLLGFFYKIVPAFTMPCAIIIKAFSQNLTSQNLTSQNLTIKKTIIKIFLNSVIFIICIITIVFALEIITNHHFMANMLNHQKRGIQIESSYGSFLIFKNLLLGKISAISFNYGSYNISTNFYFEKIARNFGHLLLLCFYCGLFLLLLKKKKSANKGTFAETPKLIISEADFLDITLIIILLLLAFQKVLSTQFFIWLIPVAAIWLTKNRSKLFLIIFSSLFLGTFFIFSVEYLALIQEQQIVVIALFLRNILLVTFALYLAIKFFLQPKFRC
jgi:hypothetical protein